nr:MAG TPA: hypothetical protein [Caudoviricetes sp.]
MEKERLEKIERILDKVVDRVEADIENMSYTEITTVISLLTMCKYYSSWTFSGVINEKDGEKDA